jgi:hypothetical protein
MFHNSSILGHSIVAIAVLACARSPEPRPDVMSMGWCDTEPMKPLGRPARIPAAIPVSGFGTLTGWVIQRETGDALGSAGVRLLPAAGTTGPSYSERPTDEYGGFTFDSVVVGRYQIRVRRLNSYQDSASFQAFAGSVDTVRFALRAYRCHGY